MSKKEFKSGFDQLIDQTLKKKVTDIKKVSNASKQIKATYYYDEEQLEKIKAIAYYERKPIGKFLFIAINEFINEYVDLERAEKVYKQSKEK